MDPVEISDGGQVLVDGGRVTTLRIDTAKPIASVEILEKPDQGNVTVNPDDTLALVLSGNDFSGWLPMKYKVTHTDGTTATETVSLYASPPTQEKGWGLGQHYMLEEDARGDIIVETGDNHRKVHVTESDEGLSRADIAALEGLSQHQITTSWLLANPEYGGSEDMALQTDVGMDVWYGLGGWRSDPSSHWLLFERGYEYEGTGRIILPKTYGESELHPLHVTSWGSGDRPTLTDEVQIFQGPASNVVFSDLRLTGGVRNYEGDNTIFSDVQLHGRGFNVQNVDNFTLHDSEITHVAPRKPDAAFWSGNTTGLFAHNVDGILIEGTLVHHNGWQDGYQKNGSIAGGAPPNGFSHNVYLQSTTTDVTFRDNIISQAASVGAQIRGGGYVEDNLFVDNNVAVNFLGGQYAGAGPVGNYTLFADNVVTSAGYKQMDYFIGAFSMGISNEAVDTTLLDNLVAHIADPNDPQEQAEKGIAHFALRSLFDPAYDDTIVYNWLGSNTASRHPLAYDRNTDGVNSSLADQTTIQDFASSLLGASDATIAELMDYIGQLADSPFDDQVTADDIIAYFQAGFGIAANGSEAQTDHRFVPNALGDGVRWDNRINWTTEDVPDDGDTVDLAGNRVEYGGTTQVGSLDLGSGGQLGVNSGKLAVRGTLETGVDGGHVGIEGAGQFWTAGYDGGHRLTIDATGGRLANTGDFTGQTTIQVSGQAQAILATAGASMTLGAGSELRIDGSRADVGFDGGTGGTAILQIEDGATLSFKADGGGISTLGEFRSGHWDHAASPVRSGVSMDGQLRIDLGDYAGGGGTFTLIDADALGGAFDDIFVHGAYNAWNVQFVADYHADELLLNLSRGTGQVSYTSVGTSSGAGESADLWRDLAAGQSIHDASQPILHPQWGELPDLAML